MKSQKALLLLFISIFCPLKNISANVLRQEKAPELTIIGRLNLADGIARQSADLIEALKDEIDIAFIPVCKINCEGLSAKAQSIVKKTRNKKYGEIVIYENNLPYPEEHFHLFFEDFIKGREPNRIYIAYSMSESSLIPQIWVDLLNTYFDLVAVPDSFLVEAYQNSGVTIPIFVLPLGLNFQKLLQAPLHAKKDTPFVFGNLSTALDRKNHLLLIQAFKKAFGDRTDVQLLINARYSENETKMKILSELRNQNRCNITFKENWLNGEEYFQLLNNLDCYVSLSKAEGYSIQPREAMALGIPTIVTNNTGQKTICDTGLVLPIETPIVQEAYFPYFKSYVGTNSTCSVDEAAKALLEMYENYESYLEKAEQARQWAATTDFAYLRPYYLSLLCPKKVSLGEENLITPEEIITNSPELFEKFTHIIEQKEQRNSSINHSLKINRSKKFHKSKNEKKANSQPLNNQRSSS